MITEYNFLDYVQYGSAFKQDSMMDYQTYELWDRFMKKGDKLMMKRMYSALAEICPTMYKFICDNYNIAQQQIQLDEYNKIDGKYAATLLF